MRSVCVLVVLAACTAPSDDWDLGERPVDYQAPPGAGGIVLSGPTTVVEGIQYQWSVTDVDLMVGETVALGWATTLGPGRCPFRGQSGGRLCLDITTPGGSARPLGITTAIADPLNPGQAIATFDITVPTSPLSEVYLQAYRLAGSDSATSNPLQVTVNDPGFFGNVLAVSASDTDWRVNPDGLTMDGGPLWLRKWPVGGGDTIEALDPDTLVATGASFTTPIPGGNTSIGLDPVTGNMYVVRSGNDAVVVDPSDGSTVAGPIELAGATPGTSSTYGGILVESDGTLHVQVRQAPNEIVEAYDAGLVQVESWWAPGAAVVGHDMDLTPDETTAFAIGNDGMIHVFDWTQPGRPEIASWAHTSSTPDSIAVSESEVYLGIRSPELILVYTHNGSLLYTASTGDYGGASALMWDDFRGNVYSTHRDSRVGPNNGLGVVVRWDRYR